jgi:hypothetical protein
MPHEPYHTGYTLPEEEMRQKPEPKEPKKEKPSPILERGKFINKKIDEMEKG